MFSGGVQSLPALQPGETKEITVDTANNAFFGYGLRSASSAPLFPRDAAMARTVSTRRAVIDQLFPWGSQGSNEAPLLLAWRKGPVLDVDLPGDQPNRVGEGLFLIPLGMTLDSQQVVRRPDDDPDRRREHVQ